MKRRKTYHKHGFLVQIKRGKIWVDYEGVAGSTQVIREMGGHPECWRKCQMGYEIYPPEPKYPDYK